MAEFLAAVTFFPFVATKLTDFIRNAFDKADTAPKWLWNVVPMVIGVAAALLYELEYADLIPNLPEKLQGLEGGGNQILTGIGIGAVASFWHELEDLFSSKAKANKATGTQV